jgi:uncharacterized membrane protein YccC
MNASLAAWLRQNQARFAFSLRMLLAGVFSYLLGEALGLTQSYWAVLSAVIVIQGSVGGSFTAGVNRLVGTMGGAAWGAAVAAFVPHPLSSSMVLALVIAVAPLAVITAFRPAYRVAPITAIIVLMGSSLQQADPIDSALSRVAEIGLGSAVAIAVALLVLPARAHRLLSQSCARALSLMANLLAVLERALDGAVDAKALGELQSALRIGLAQAETRAQEAQVERANRLAAEGPDPERLVRILRRIRHDTAMLTRILTAPSEEVVSAEMREPLRAVLKALTEWLKGIAKALPNAETPPALDALDAATGRYKAALAQGRHRDADVSGSGALGQRLVVLSFLFDQMRENVKDMAERAVERARPDSAALDGAG